MRKRDEAEAAVAGETPEEPVDPITPAPILQNEVISEAGEQLATTLPASPSPLVQELRNEPNPENEHLGSSVMAGVIQNDFPALRGFTEQQSEDAPYVATCVRGPCQAPTLLLRHHLVLVASAVSGVLFRPDDGEFSARPRARLSRLVRRAPRHPV